MKSRFLLLLISVLIQSLCLAQSSKSVRQEIIYNGNRLILEPQNIRDTLVVLDPTTGKEYTKIGEAPLFPISINGKKVYDAAQLDVSGQDSKILEEKILDNFKRTFHAESLADGNLIISIHQLLINEQGKIVYSDYYDVNYIGEDKTRRKVNYAHPDELFSGIIAPKAAYKGRDVPYKIRIFLGKYVVDIKNHVISYHIR